MRIDLNDERVSDERFTRLVCGAVENRESFDIVGIRKERFSYTIKRVEELIEDKGLRCRVYTPGRIAALGAPAAGGTITFGISTVIAAASAAGIAAHNLATRNPDYEIAKHYIMKKLTVKYCKILADKYKHPK